MQFNFEHLLNYNYAAKICILFQTANNDYEFFRYELSRNQATYWLQAFFGLGPKSLKREKK